MHPQLLPDLPGKCPDIIYRDGAEWTSLKEAARRRNVTHEAMRRWSLRPKNQHRVRIHNDHRYIREV